MPDVLIRDIDSATLARIDAVATRTGQSRNALLRQLLAEFAHAQPEGVLTDEEVSRFGESTRALLDDELRAAAWRR